MSKLQKIWKNKFLQIIILFVLFQIFWLLFYYLSGSVFLRSYNIDYLIRVSTINTLGFIVFCIAAYWYFPNFIPPKKYFWFTIIAIATVIIAGMIQFKLQDWNPDFFTRMKQKKLNVDPSSEVSINFVPLAQAIGAKVKAMLNILVYLLLGIGFAYMKDWFIKDRYARTLEKEKLKAELALLRYQLNPHFLFNIINNIYYLAIIKSDKTPEAILKVSELLRYVLDNKEEKVPLEKELDYLREFVKLQQFRFPDQFVDISINIYDDHSKYQIAPLLLITFAENAFKHGEPGTEKEPVVLNLDLKDAQLKYRVTNRINHNDRKDNTTGIGLNNLKRRLYLLYPNKHQIELKKNNEYFEAYLKIDLS